MNLSLHNLLDLLIDESDESGEANSSDQKILNCLRSGMSGSENIFHCPFCNGDKSNEIRR